jgi:hypothetical protein
MNNIPLLIQGIGLVLVTLLIPIWISLFRNTEKQIVKLDERVLVDYILEGKNILIYLGLILVPPFLWYSSNLTLKTYSIVYPVLGIFLFSKNVNRAINWVSGKESQIRIDFLNSLKKFEGTEELWHSVWQIKNIDREKEYLDRFFDKLGLLIKNKKGEYLHILSDYLRDFKENLENRDLRNIIFENYFPRLLDWCYDSWIKFEALRHGNKDEFDDWEWEKNFIIKRELEELFEKNLKILIQKGALYHFIDKMFKKKINEWKIDKDFLKDILDQFLDILFEESVNGGASYNIWNLGFPKEWKITSENLKKKDIILEIIWINYYIWAFNRFQIASEDVDENLTYVTEELFPEVHHIVWVKILIFKFTRDENLRARLKFMVERKWNFGLPIMAKASFASEGGESKNIREFEKEEKNAFDLAFELFGDDFSEKRIKEYISTLKDLEGEFEKESLYDYRRTGILDMFEKMLEYKSKKSKQ